MAYLEKLKAAYGRTTQVRLAKAIGCSQGLLSRWLNDEIIPGPGYFAALKRVAGITADELVAAKVRKLSVRKRRAA